MVYGASTIDKTLNTTQRRRSCKNILRIAYCASTIAKTLNTTQRRRSAIKFILRIAYGASTIDKTQNNTQRREPRNNKHLQIWHVPLGNVKMPTIRSTKSIRCPSPHSNEQCKLNWSWLAAGGKFLGFCDVKLRFFLKISSF